MCFRLKLKFIVELIVPVILCSYGKSVNTGCKEIQSYSLPFGQAVVSMYKPTSHFN